MASEPELHEGVFRVSTSAFVMLDPCHFEDKEKLVQLLEGGDALLVLTNSDGPYEVVAPNDEDADPEISIFPSLADWCSIIEPDQARSVLESSIG